MGGLGGIVALGAGVITNDAGVARARRPRYPDLHAALHWSKPLASAGCLLAQMPCRDDPGGARKRPLVFTILPGHGRLVPPVTTPLPEKVTPSRGERRRDRGAEQAASC